MWTCQCVLVCCIGCIHTYRWKQMPRHIKIQKNQATQRLFVSDAKDFHSVVVSLCGLNTFTYHNRSTLVSLSFLRTLSNTTAKSRWVLAFLAWTPPSFIHTGTWPPRRPPAVLAVWGSPGEPLRMLMLVGDPPAPRPSTLHVTHLTRCTG